MADGGIVSDAPHQCVLAHPPKGLRSAEPTIVLKLKTNKRKKKQGRLKNNISPSRELFIENHNM